MKSKSIFDVKFGLFFYLALFCAGVGLTYDSFLFSLINLMLCAYIHLSLVIENG